MTDHVNATTRRRQPLSLVTPLNDSAVTLPGTPQNATTTPCGTGGRVPSTSMSASEVAERLNVRVKRVYELGIPSVRISPRTIRWQRATVEAWIAAHTNNGG